MYVHVHIKTMLDVTSYTSVQYLLVLSHSAEQRFWAKHLLGEFLVFSLSVFGCHCIGGRGGREK